MFRATRVRLSHINAHRPSPAMLVALLALFVAMGGVGYAAFRLPRNSVGSRQIKANAINSSKVANGSLLGGDFKAGQLPAGAQGLKGDVGPQGLKGDTGDACLPSNPDCKGPKGDTGPQGPGAISVSLGFPIDGKEYLAAAINGMTLTVSCGTMNGIILELARIDDSHTLYGWGTATQDGVISPESAVVINGAAEHFTATSANSVQLEMAASSTAAGQPVKFTRFSADGLRAGQCNVHAVIIPPS